MTPDLTTLIIESDRLRLVAITSAYIDAIFQEFTAEIATYMYPRPATFRTETEAFVLASQQENADCLGLTMVMTDKETGEFMGCVGLHRLETRWPEFGIWVKKDAHGKKLGREAIHALKQWADQYLDFDYLLYPADYRNRASRKIPESLGGRIIREYAATSGLGAELQIVEYRINRQPLRAKPLNS